MLVKINGGPFDTEQDAEGYKIYVLGRFHPAGYGTTVKVEQDDEGRWFVKGYRYSSCD